MDSIQSQQSPRPPPLAQDAGNHASISISNDGDGIAFPADPDPIDGEKQAEIFQLILGLKATLTQKTSECEVLRMKLNESDKLVEALGQELNECKLTMFQDKEDSKRIHEEVTKSKRLEEDYVRLMGDYLNLSERYEHNRHTQYDNYLAKTNAINNYECLMSRDAMKHELEVCRADLERRVADVSLLSAKLRNMEEDRGVKEKCISELKKSLDDAKVTHKHEITVLEEYIQCLKNTICSYEKTLANYMDELEGVVTGQAETSRGAPGDVSNNEQCTSDRHAFSRQILPKVGPKESDGDTTC